MNRIKGGGGGLLREKIVAQAGRRGAIVVDVGKLSPRLGKHRPLPLEVHEFAWRSQARFLESLGGAVMPRTGHGGLDRTDLGNTILGSRFGPIISPAALAGTGHARADLVGKGLFIGIASDLTVVCGGGGGIRHFRNGACARGSCWT